MTTAHVRRARPADLPRVALLAAEHADRLRALLFGTTAPRLHCFVA
ncbi:hypothetical protein [Streptomyces himastatinicus]|nr:hypothetical protein [Streptomyces himastatinicus]